MITRLCDSLRDLRELKPNDSCGYEFVRGSYISARRMTVDVMSEITGYPVDTEAVCEAVCPCGCGEETVLRLAGSYYFSGSFHGGRIRVLLRHCLEECHITYYNDWEIQSDH